MKKIILFFVVLIGISVNAQQDEKKLIEAKFKIILEEEVGLKTIDKGEIIISKDTYSVYTDVLNYEMKESWFCVFDDLKGTFYQIVFDVESFDIYYNGYQINLNDLKGKDYLKYKGLENINFQLIQIKFLDEIKEKPEDIRIVRKEINFKVIGISKDHFIKLKNGNYKLYLDLYNYERL